MRAVEHWNRLPGEVVGVHLCKMFEMMFKTQLDVVLSNPLQLALP